MELTELLTERILQIQKPNLIFSCHFQNHICQKRVQKQYSEPEIINTMNYIQNINKKNQ